MSWFHRLFGIHQHKWSKWENVEVIVHLFRGGSHPATYQLRKCEECGWEDLRKA